VAAVDLFLGFFDLGADPLTLLQSLNALFAAAALALFYRLARRLALDAPLSALLTALLGLGYAYWYYATNAESYPISIFFLILAFLSAQQLPSHPSPARIARPGVWLGLAIGFHVTCVLALPALLLAMWPGPSCEKPLRRVVIAFLAASLLALAPYAATYTYFDKTDPISGLADDLRATVDPGYRGKVWWSVEPDNVRRQWIGLAEAMAPAQQSAVSQPYPTLSAGLRLGFLALTLLPLALLLPRRERARRAFMLLAWLGPTFVFFSAYNTASAKFSAYQWIPLLLLIGLAIRSLRPMRFARLTALGLVVVLAAGTLFVSLETLRRQADRASNPHLARALAIRELTEPDDVVVHLGRGENQYQKVYTPYFAVRRSIVLDSYFDRNRQSGEVSLGILGDRIREHMRLARRVLLLDDAAGATESRQEFEEFHGLEPGSLGRFFAGHRPRVAAEHPDLGRLWRLEGPPVVPASR
jgi:hypothetical protein